MIQVPDTTPSRFANILDKAIEVTLFVCAATIIFSIAIAQAAALLSFIFWLVKIASQRPYKFTPSIIQLPIGLFILARLLSIAFSQHLSVSLDAFRTEIFFYGLFFVVLHEFDIADEKKIKRLVWLIFTAGVLSAFYGTVLQVLGKAPRAVSTTAGYYTLGMYLCTVLALAFPLGSKGAILKPKWLWMLGSLIMLAGLLLTFNRLHWVAAGLAIFVGGLLYERRILLVFIVAGLLAVLFIPEISARFQMILHLGSHMSDRDFIWQGAALIWDQHPITGFGLRTFREIFPLFAEVQDKGIGSWHNDYLQVYMESGLMGLLPFLAIFATIVVTALRSIKRMARDNSLRILLSSLLLTMVPFVLAGFMLDALMHLLFFIIAGLMASITTKVKIEGKNNPELVASGDEDTDNLELES
jgi:O-antigen ligase